MTLAILALAAGLWYGPFVHLPTVLGTAVYATRVEGRTFVVERLPDGQCAVIFGGVREVPLTPKEVCAEVTR